MAEESTVMEQAVPANAPKPMNEDTSAPLESPKLLKRKQSTKEEVEAGESSKKARIEPEAAPFVDSERRAKETSPSDRDKHQEAEAAQRRRPLRVIDERKRGKRLFGAVLGVLGQNSSPQLAKRREIDRKQREKLKAQSQEDDAAREVRLAKLTEARRREQRKFDKQSMRIRHSNMLSMAHFLRTDTEPRLYYKPWELLPEETERIERQVKEAEERIAHELAEADMDEKEEGGRSERREISKDHNTEDRNKSDITAAPFGNRDEARETGEEVSETNMADDGPEPPRPVDTHPPSKTEGSKEPGLEASQHGNMSKDDADDAGDEGEDMDGDDAVIY